MYDNFEKSLHVIKLSAKYTDAPMNLAHWISFLIAPFPVRHRR